MALMKVAPTTEWSVSGRAVTAPRLPIAPQWHTVVRGDPPSTLRIAYDAGSGHYYIATDDETPAAHIIYSGGWIVSDIRGSRMGRIVQAAGAPGRVVE